ncbi:TetR/AcrR family transcriptional regulator [Rhizobium leguminosarum]|uniref:TetR/AcrR family transcriptional regulator n=1 Tax=Rhizobium leguminosarum TaxID=384 RepID=UPI00144296D8|nr:TetR/AcrR family transcriptional regulator [Rhizobium leguminosarum]NKK68470.1 TetR family transcriptional regulator [Rhizobium leguminosarum bv. viciae]NKL10051.1 TetR family transcriptional regulator [Rhizobium leguminosarum bv. viciae]NKL87763.1 TetR family transcriptional regulator [Rhizobium leguminosarum bv. viciae]NKL95183.1 TetR family transcriptional regulator [Rhizobium leguminosarum bv. viciae]NKM96334.1 TetR family transcriptional regulator [Rhizobium leguminosarum bv. viciae]
MGRTREFDEEVVLKGAMHIFRKHGYQGASIRDLEEATGLKGGSIYHAFGDKAGLFDAAFGHYNRTVLEGRIERFAPPGTGLKGLRELFLSLLHEPDDGSLGCLITNMAVEFGGGADRHPRVEAALGLLRTTFRSRLTEASTFVQDADGAKADRTATRLLAFYQGLLVLIRGDDDKAGLRQAIEDEFNQLETIL